jgi:hypothetical protein
MSEPWKTGAKGRLNISGTFQFKDKDGKTVGEMQILPGSGIPLDRFTPEQQQQLIKEYGHGADHR